MPSHYVEDYNSFVRRKKKEAFTTVIREDGSSHLEIYVK